MIMSQQEVINVMKGNRWYSLDELTDEVGRSKNSILVCLNKIDGSCGYVIEKKRASNCRKFYRLVRKEDEVI